MQDVPSFLTDAEELQKHIQEKIDTLEDLENLQISIKEQPNISSDLKLPQTDPLEDLDNFLKSIEKIDQVERLKKLRECILRLKSLDDLESLKNYFCFTKFLENLPAFKAIREKVFSLDKLLDIKHISFDYNGFDLRHIEYYQEINADNLNNEKVINLINENIISVNTALCVYPHKLKKNLETAISLLERNSKLFEIDGVKRALLNGTISLQLFYLLEEKLQKSEQITPDHISFIEFVNAGGNYNELLGKTPSENLLELFSHIPNLYKNIRAYFSFKIPFFLTRAVNSLLSTNIDCLKTMASFTPEQFAALINTRRLYGKNLREDILYSVFLENVQYLCSLIEEGKLDANKISVLSLETLNFIIDDHIFPHITGKENWEGINTYRNLTEESSFFEMLQKMLKQPSIQNVLKGVYPDHTASLDTILQFFLDLFNRFKDDKTFIDSLPTLYRLANDHIIEPIVFYPLDELFYLSELLKIRDVARAIADKTIPYNLLCDLLRIKTPIFLIDLMKLQEYIKKIDTLEDIKELQILINTHLNLLKNLKQPQLEKLQDLILRLKSSENLRVLKNYFRITNNFKNSPALKTLIEQKKFSLDELDFIYINYYYGGININNLKNEEVIALIDKNIISVNVALCVYPNKLKNNLKSVMPLLNSASKLLEIEDVKRALLNGAISPELFYLLEERLEKGEQITPDHVFFIEFVNKANSIIPNTPLQDAPPKKLFELFPDIPNLYRNIRTYYSFGIPSFLERAVNVLLLTNIDYLKTMASFTSEQFAAVIKLVESFELKSSQEPYYPETIFSFVAQRLCSLIEKGKLDVNKISVLSLKTLDFIINDHIFPHIRGGEDWESINNLIEDDKFYIMLIEAIIQPSIQGLLKGEYNHTASLDETFQYLIYLFNYFKEDTKFLYFLSTLHQLANLGIIGPLYFYDEIRLNLLYRLININGVYNALLDGTISPENLLFICSAESFSDSEILLQLSPGIFETFELYPNSFSKFKNISLLYNQFKDETSIVIKRLCFLMENNTAAGLYKLTGTNEIIDDNIENFLATVDFFTSDAIFPYITGQEDWYIITILIIENKISFESLLKAFQQPAMQSMLEKSHLIFNYHQLQPSLHYCLLFAIDRLTYLNNYKKTYTCSDKFFSELIDKLYQLANEFIIAPIVFYTSSQLNLLFRLISINGMQEALLNKMIPANLIDFLLEKLKTDKALEDKLHKGALSHYDILKSLNPEDKTYEIVENYIKNYLQQHPLSPETLPDFMVLINRLITEEISVIIGDEQDILYGQMSDNFKSLYVETESYKFTDMFAYWCRVNIILVLKEQIQYIVKASPAYYKDIMQALPDSFFTPKEKAEMRKTFDCRAGLVPYMPFTLFGGTSNNPSTPPPLTYTEVNGPPPPITIHLSNGNTL